MDALKAEQRPAEQGNTPLRPEVQGVFSPFDKNRTAPLLDDASSGDTIMCRRGKCEETGS
jgi:hypothetical protein